VSDIHSSCKKTVIISGSKLQDESISCWRTRFLHSNWLLARSRTSLNKGFTCEMSPRMFFDFHGLSKGHRQASGTRAVNKRWVSVTVSMQATCPKSVRRCRWAMSDKEICDAHSLMASVEPKSCNRIYRIWLRHHWYIANEQSAATSYNVRASCTLFT